MRENEKEAKNNNSFCLGHCVDGGACHHCYSRVQFWIAEFVVPEGHSSGDVQLAVGCSGLGLRREVIDGDKDLELTSDSGWRSYFL